MNYTLLFYIHSQNINVIIILNSQSSFSNISDKRQLNKEQTNSPVSAATQYIRKPEEIMVSKAPEVLATYQVPATMKFVTRSGGIHRFMHESNFA